MSDDGFISHHGRLHFQLLHYNIIITLYYVYRIQINVTLCVHATDRVYIQHMHQRIVSVDIQQLHQQRHSTRGSIQVTFSKRFNARFDSHTGAIAVTITITSSITHVEPIHRWPRGRRWQRRKFFTSATFADHRSRRRRKRNRRKRWSSRCLTGRVKTDARLRQIDKLNDIICVKARAPPSLATGESEREWYVSYETKLALCQAANGTVWAAKRFKNCAARRHCGSGCSRYYYGVDN